MTVLEITMPPLRRAGRRALRRQSRLAFILVLAAVAGLGGGCSASEPESQSETEASGGDAALARAHENQATDLPVEAEGVVMRLLSDDEQGSRHQRFVLRLASGQTLLVAHNIDVAPRVEDLHVGDAVAFRGEYEWSEEGGIIHWTHGDPDGDHTAGWIRHGGQVYE
jgi:hypothetical protein